MNEPELIGARLKAARLARGLSRPALAERSGVSARMIVAIERATASPTFINVAALAVALGVDLNALAIDPQEAAPYTGEIRHGARFSHRTEGEVIVEAAVVTEWQPYIAGVSYGFQPPQEHRDLDRLRWEPADDFRRNAHPIEELRVETVSDEDKDLTTRGRAFRISGPDGADLGEAAPS